MVRIQFQPDSKEKKLLICFSLLYLSLLLSKCENNEPRVQITKFELSIFKKNNKIHIHIIYNI